jgi:hypothetical protein
MSQRPSKHGLDRKFKSWRKGKSSASKSKGSLKSQVRGQERLLTKLPQEETDRRRELEQRIQELKTEIQQKQVVEKERQHAKESHGLRFLERQRLTRAERSTRNLFSSSFTPEEKKRYEAEMQRIALDQVYVAHFPHDMKYLPLFRNGVRMVDVQKKLLRRATTRKRILENLETRVKWIPADQYNRLPTEWSVELEKRTFATPAKRDTAETEINDSRFATSLRQHAAIFEAAEEAESAARKEIEANTSSSSDDDDEVEVTEKPSIVINDTKHQDESSNSDNDTSSSEDEDETNLLPSSGKTTISAEQSADLSDSDSGTGSSEDEVEINVLHSNGKNAINAEQSDYTSDSDDSSDDDSSDDSSVERDTSPTNKGSIDTPMDDFDDFLTAAQETNAFETAKQDAPNYDHDRSDKSKGWATQKQRPGQFKKRRVRK